jgi:cytochrome c553
MASEPGYGEDHEARLVVRAEPSGASREAVRMTARERAATHYHPGRSRRSAASDAPGCVRCHHCGLGKGLNKESHP